MQHPFRRVLAAVGLAAAVAAVGAAAPRDKDKAADAPKAGADGWVPLFNGKDLSGWKIHPNPNPGAYEKTVPVKGEGDAVVGFAGETKDGKTVPLWTVKDGLLVGSGPHSHLFTEKDDYADFRYRVEAKINDKGNSGQYFRAKFEPGFPTGYEAQINATGGDPIKTGSLYPDGRAKLDRKMDILVLDTAPNKPDEFFVQEVVAEGDHIQIFVNGKKTVDFTHPAGVLKKGHFALQGHDPGTVVTFKKVEWQPLKK